MNKKDTFLLIIVFLIGLYIVLTIHIKSVSGVGRYQLFQGRVKELISIEGSDAGGINEEIYVFKIDTKTGKVSKYVRQVIITRDKKNDIDFDGFYPVDSYKYDPSYKHKRVYGSPKYKAD